MKKKLISSILACVLMFGCMGPAAAAEGPHVVSLESLMCEAVDMAHADVGRIGGNTRATESVSWTISAGKTKRAADAFPMEAGETVTINCSYSPSAAAVDFGLIAPDNKFYYQSGENGSINQTIEIPARGQYYFAVRNRSNNSVEVLGFVNY